MLSLRWPRLTTPTPGKEGFWYYIIPTITAGIARATTAAVALTQTAITAETVNAVVAKSAEALQSQEVLKSTSLSSHPLLQQQIDLPEVLALVRDMSVGTDSRFHSICLTPY